MNRRAILKSLIALPISGTAIQLATAAPASILPDTEAAANRRMGRNPATCRPVFGPIWDLALAMLPVQSISDWPVFAEEVQPAIRELIRELEIKALIRALATEPLPDLPEGYCYLENPRLPGVNDIDRVDLARAALAEYCGQISR